MTPARKRFPADLEMIPSLHQTLKELADVKFVLDASSIVTITDKDGNIIYVNDKFCEISKFSREELIGQNHRIINSGYHPKEFFRELWQTILGGKIWRGEIRNRAKDGTYFWMHSTIVPFLSEDNKPYQFVVIRNEITQRKQMEEVLKSLPQRIIQAQEQERERISREIHDDLGQSLATLKMLIQSGFSQAASSSQSLNKSLTKTLTYLDLIMDKTRNLAADLRPSTLEVLGLTSSLNTLINDFRTNHALKIRASLNALGGIKLKGEMINLYRIVQEVLTNIIKHAQAENINIAFVRKDKVLILKIRDDGKGFYYDQNHPEIKKNSGLGLSTMQERAKLLNGTLEIVSELGRGTQVTVTVPVA